MSWFSILQGLISIVNRVAKYMADKQLLDAGQYKEIAENNEKSMQKIIKAQRARDAVLNGGGVPYDKDPNNRDN